MSRSEGARRTSRLVVLTMAAVIAVSGCASTPPHAHAPAGANDVAVAAPAAGSHAVASAVRLGVRVGWSHDRAGARAAAAAYVGATVAVVSAGPLQRRDVIAVLASSRYAPELVELTDRRVDDLLFGLGSRGIAPSDVAWREFPLTARIDGSDADRSSVRVWSLITLTTRGSSVPRQLWRTSSIELVWEADDWKVDRWDSTNGPTPALPSESAISPTDAVADAAGWPPVATEGGGDGS